VQENIAIFSSLQYIESYREWDEFASMCYLLLKGKIRVCLIQHYSFCNQNKNDFTKHI